MKFGNEFPWATPTTPDVNGPLREKQTCYTLAYFLEFSMGCRAIYGIGEISRKMRRKMETDLAARDFGCYLKCLAAFNSP